MYTNFWRHWRLTDRHLIKVVSKKSVLLTTYTTKLLLSIMGKRCSYGSHFTIHILFRLSLSYFYIHIGLQSWNTLLSWQWFNDDVNDNITFWRKLSLLLPLPYDKYFLYLFCVLENQLLHCQSSSSKNEKSLDIEQLSI